MNMAAAEEEMKAEIAAAEEQEMKIAAKAEIVDRIFSHCRHSRAARVHQQVEGRSRWTRIRTLFFFAVALLGGQGSWKKLAHGLLVSSDRIHPKSAT